MPFSTSFSVSRANSTTFLIIENDAYGEQPYIYAKVHPSMPILVLSDTGCNKPAEEIKDADITQLRQLLETYPVVENDNKPINPGGERSYVVILTHCHYDHIGGITQFLRGGTTEILASAAGRDFIESDLEAHSLCKHMKIPVPVFKVTHWAQSYERLTWPLQKRLPGDGASFASKDKGDEPIPVELGITILHTPGHTPDELAWVDHVENTIYVGDSFYELGSLFQPIIFPPQGNMMDWSQSCIKIENFMYWINRPKTTSGLNDAVEDDDGDGWTVVQRPPRISAAHQTCNADLQQLIWALRWFFSEVAQGHRPILHSDQRYGELYLYYLSEVREGDPKQSFGLWCPARLLLEPEEFLTLLGNGTEWTKSRPDNYGLSQNFNARTEQNNKA